MHVIFKQLCAAMSIMRTNKPSEEAQRHPLLRLIRQPLTCVALIFLLVFAVIAVLGYTITPDPSPNANQQYIEISAQPPGFSVPMIRIQKNTVSNPGGIIRRMIYGRTSQLLIIPYSNLSFVNDSVVITGYDPFPGALIRTQSFALADVLYPLADNPMYVFENDTVCFTGADQSRWCHSTTELRSRVVSESMVKKTFWLGTDRHGRDVLSMLMIGTRVSLSVGLISVIISLVAGLIIGSLGGYFRGWVDSLVVWFINVVWSIPTLLLVIAITFALGKGFWQIFVAVGMTMWVDVARVVRGQILSVREKEYIEAARALGFGHFRIITRHILPNILAPVIVISASNFAAAILIEAGLSFLGLGVQPPVPSWGNMIRDNYSYIILDKAYLAIIPGLAIMLSVMAFMIIGNGLRDALDVKIAGRSNL